LAIVFEFAASLPRGHLLQAGRMLVGSIACSCGRHLTWGCECGAVTYGPVLPEGCSLLDGHHHLLAILGDGRADRDDTVTGRLGTTCCSGDSAAQLTLGFARKVGVLRSQEVVNRMHDGET